MKINDILATFVYYVIKVGTFLIVYILINLSARYWYENYSVNINFKKSINPILNWLMTILICHNVWTKKNIWAKIRQWLESKF